MNPLSSSDPSPSLSHPPELADGRVTLDAGGADPEQIERHRGPPARTRARNAYEWGANLAQYGTLSIAASGLALGRSRDPGVRELATAEIAEQRALVGVLRTIGTPTPADLDPALRASLREHEASVGAEFDRVYARAQVGAHRDLLALMESLLRDARRGDRSEFIAKGVARIAIATIREHQAMSERLVARLDASAVKEHIALSSKLGA